MAICIKMTLGTDSQTTLSIYKMCLVNNASLYHNQPGWWVQKFILNT